MSQMWNVSFLSKSVWIISAMFCIKNSQAACSQLHTEKKKNVHLTPPFPYSHPHHYMMMKFTWGCPTHRIHALHKAVMYEGDKTLVGCAALATIGIIQVLSVECKGHQGEHEDDGQTKDGHQDQRYTCRTQAPHL